MGGWRRWLFGLAVLAAGGCAGTGDLSRIPFDSPEHRPPTERALARWTSEELVAFEGERQFGRYLHDLRAAGRARGEWWARQRSDTPHGDESIWVTGSRIPPRNASITNVQDAGVDEGDIVKQIDQFLLILQDGRIFVVDIGGGRLALTDRADIYRDPQSDMWYDEMLVHGDRIVVAGYSYDERASEIALFRLSPDGRLTREDIFRISSNDYYDARNYATRLVDGNLLLYTPIEVTALELGERVPWPTVRRWRSDQAAPGSGSPGRRLFGANRIYRPTITSLEPTIHSVALCPLGAEAGMADLECRTTAFVGPTHHRFYVSTDAAYVWVLPTSEDDAARFEPGGCRPDRPAFDDNVRGALYRLPHDRDDPAVVAVRGYFFDHFAMQEQDGVFRALVGDFSVRCDYQALDVEAADEIPLHLTLFSTPLSAFGTTLSDTPRSAYTALPPLGSESRMVIDRFTDEYLVYGTLGFSRYLAEHGEPLDNRLVAVPVSRPRDARVLTVPHNLIRAERSGDDVVVTGYRGDSALHLSLIDLSGEPRLASTHRFDGRYESEGRSHAFNSSVGPDGSGLIGLPTVPRSADGHRAPWWSRASDMDFLAVDAAGGIRGAGRLAAAPEDRGQARVPLSQVDGEPDRDSIPGYSCEVSCIDWYGNSRPVFTGGRIFALLATELIEGRLRDGRIAEVQRLDIARASPRR